MSIFGGSERRRAARLEEWALAHGWLFREGGVAAPWAAVLGRKWQDFTVLRTLTGTFDGPPITAADCRFTGEFHTRPDPGSVVRTSRRTARVSVFSVAVPGRFPDVQVDRMARRPRNTLANAMIGGQFGEFLGEDFDRMYRVTSPDLPAARRLFSPALVQAHLGRSLDSWRLADGELIHVTEGRLEPDKVRRGAEWVRWMAGMLAGPP
ncbi:hypothetical protein [Actinomadura rupiterrae]|uniref:hypothetical protein n=1 Tax=Actinomadura rupiterrae TaxID=559627 RepID=UPI0020A5AA29|nr:hypothetical protein [Actinomadura rupiterrae]MCP2342484.1 hypothetical protein [Actinomadura rupiterrae]